MTYEAVMERVKSVPPDKLDALNEYIVYLEQGERKSCRGIAAEYANKALIETEGRAASMAFSGE